MFEVGGHQPCARESVMRLGVEKNRLMAPHVEMRSRYWEAGFSVGKACRREGKGRDGRDELYSHRCKVNTASRLGQAQLAGPCQALRLTTLRRDVVDNPRAFLGRIENGTHGTICFHTTSATPISVSGRLFFW